MSGDSKFWHFSQNNSGGETVVDEGRGLGHHVVIEAQSVRDANDRALGVGLYFDGRGDCDCCGNRWHPLYKHHEGDALPSVYGIPVWAKTDWLGGTVFIHYLDGSKERVDLPPASFEESKIVNWVRVPEKWRDKIGAVEGRKALGLAT